MRLRLKRTKYKRALRVESLERRLLFVGDLQSAEAFIGNAKDTNAPLDLAGEFGSSRATAETEVSPLEASSATAPNVIFILADDAGYADFGFQGGGIDGDFADLTPNIDSIATGGVQFSQGYANAPVCTPTRAGLLTGRYQSRFGVESVTGTEENAGLPTTEKTIADTLKASGYQTYAIGKWHLGEDLPEHHPDQRGFDEYFGHLSGGRTYFQYTGVNAASRLQRNGTFIAESTGQPYLTDMFGAEAATYIDSHATNHPASPFFMYLAFNGVHTPLEADPVRLADPRIQDITVPQRKTLAAMTIAVDDAVGAVLAKLNERGLMNDTLIVFANDNGGPEDNLSLNAPNWSDNGPLRGNKAELYEGGIRIPFAVKWPAGIAPTLVGQTLPDQVITHDLLPTVLDAANVPLLAGQSVDGTSLLPRLNGTSPTPLQRPLFWRQGGSTGGQSAVRIGDWKLRRENGTGNVELFNLATDLGETTNLAASNPDKVAELVAAHAEWENGMVEPIWGGGAPTISNPNLVRNPSTTTFGYELEKTGTGFSYMADELRDALSLSEDWELEWTMETRVKAGYSRNGSIVLGDRLQVNRFIRISLGFGSGVASITELENNNATSATWPSIPADTEAELRLQYDAATRSLTFRYGTNAISHVLTATYDGDTLDHAGYGLQSSALTTFSPILRHITPRAPDVKPTWAQMAMERDYQPGTYDGPNGIGGNFMGGTEGMSLVAHKGQLFAGIGYWNDVFFGSGSSDPHPGAQVLVKTAFDQPWKQDVAFGQAFLRVETLQSITFTTDKNGVPLAEPVNLLLAGSGEMPPPYGASSLRRPVVWVRNDSSGTWTPTYPGTAQAGGRTTRLIVDHIDSVTGTHHVFVGYGGANNTLVRGGYNSATGLIDWELSTPELTGSERMLSAGVLNGVLYACIGSNGVDGDNVGGIYWREDGPIPKWHFVTEWPINGTKNPDIRGFTAVQHPNGFNYDVAIVTLESFGKVYRIDPIGGDPRNGHVVSEDLNIQEFLGDEWNDGVSIGFPTLSAYNNMPEVIHPGTGQPVHLIGVAVEHPLGYGTPEGNSSYYLIRHNDATYEWGQVFDSAEPLPNNDPGENGLRATRAVSLSPFPEDGGKVLYFSGFDAAAQVDNTYHNTAWIYRATLPQVDVTPPTVTNVKVAGSTWNAGLNPQGLFNFLGNVDPIEGLGYSLVTNPMRTLPWTDVDTIYIQFSEDIGSFDNLDFSLVGVPNTLPPPLGGPVGDYKGAGLIPPANVTYDETNYRATIKLTSAVQADRLNLKLFATSIADAAMNSLDGDGNMTGGDDYTINFSILPGDETGNGAVNTDDVSSIRANTGQVAGLTAGFDVFADLNGDGAVNTNDVSFVRGRTGSILPISSPPSLTLLVPPENSIQQSADQKQVWSQRVDSVFAAPAWLRRLSSPPEREFGAAFATNVIAPRKRSETGSDPLETNRIDKLISFAAEAQTTLQTRFQLRKKTT